MTKKGKILLPSLAIIVSLVFSCSPRISQKALNFFFDGVPPTAESKPHEPDSIAPVLISEAGSIERRPGYESNYYLHQPYRAKYCTACHKDNNPGEIIAPNKELCSYCHDGYEAYGSVVHGPVDAGMCQTCHDPHMSAYPGMLKGEVTELCLVCHPEGQLSEFAHDPGKDNKCTHCHDPHAGGVNLLKGFEER